MTDPYKKIVYRLFDKLVKKEGATLLAIGGMPDHIHVFVTMGSRKSIANFMSNIKSVSSKFINENFSEEIGYFAWQEGYGGFSEGRSGVKRIIKYICNQEEHHKNMTFDEELKLLSGS